jgi:hypothetical protein
MKNFRQAYEAFLKQLNERGGYDYDDIGQGHDTSDEVTEDDINNTLEEISIQINILDKWITDVREFGDVESDEVYADFEKVRVVLQNIVDNYDLNPAIAHDPVSFTDKEPEDFPREHPEDMAQHG